MVEADPTGILASNPSGQVVYANAAATVALGGRELVGRPISEVLAGFSGATANQVDIGGGRTAWYLAYDTLNSLRDLRFAAEVGDALAASLNLRRTLTRLVSLAVPAFGSEAAVTLRDEDTLRQTSGGRERRIPFAHLSDDERHYFDRVMTSAGPVPSLEAGPEWLDRLCLRETARSMRSPTVPVLSVPLRAHGRPLGFLSVVTGANPPDVTGLETLARRGSVAIAAAGVYEERSHLASTLRSALRPPPIPAIEGMDIGASYRPAQEATDIGGDFYEVRADADGWSATVGDVCGKGVEAAVLTGQVRQSLRTVSLVTRDPVRRLELLNETMLETDGTSFATLLHAVMTPRSGGVGVELVNGGHPLPMLRHANGTVEEIRASGPIVGMLDDVSFEPGEFEIEPGETLLLYTDGLIEAKGSSGYFGPERVTELLADSGGMTAAAICDRLMQNVLAHLDGRPHDDVALLAVQVQGQG